jgi:stalled ribosome alternative rescue factor ArfA
VHGEERKKGKGSSAFDTRYKWPTWYTIEDEISEMNILATG